MKVNTTHRFLSESIGWPNEALECTLSRILTLIHPVSDLLDHGGFTLERASHRNVIPEPCFKFLVSHFFSSSCDHCEYWFEILCCQSIVRDRIDQGIERLHIQFTRPRCFEDIVKSFSGAIEKVLDNLNYSSGTIFSFIAKHCRLLLAPDAWVGFWLLLWWVEILFELYEQRWNWARRTVPIEAKLF